MDLVVFEVGNICMCLLTLNLIKSAVERQKKKKLKRKTKLIEEEDKKKKKNVMDAATYIRNEIGIHLNRT